MRRRRQKNPLLMRIIGISILVHIIALPILAHYGAFKKLKREYLETRMVVLPPPKVEKDKPEIKKPQHVAHKAAPTNHAAAHARLASHKSNPFQPKVIASAGNKGGDSGDDSNTVDNSGNGKLGQLPTGPATKGSQGDNAPAPPPAAPPAPPPTNTAPPKVAQNPAPPPKVEAPPQPKPEVKHDPVYTDAVPTSSPQPSIPDDLRSEAMDSTFVAEFTVGADGTPTQVKVAQSTGNDELDRIALDAAKQWKFKPATRDGQPIESRVRLHIEFQVS